MFSACQSASSFSMANFSLKTAALTCSIYAIIMTEEDENNMLPHCDPGLLGCLVVDFVDVDPLSVCVAACLTHT